MGVGGGGAGEAAARLVLVAVLLHSLVQCTGANTENNARLTTNFGKPQQKPQNNNHPPKELGGFPCNKSSDCDIANTTCMNDPRDGRKRCLCGDRSVPKAAACRNKFRVVKFPCNADQECVENAECVLPMNITPNTTSGRNFDVSKLQTGPNTKICWCREPYEVDDDHCSNFGRMLFPSAVLLLTSVHALFSKV